MQFHEIQTRGEMRTWLMESLTPIDTPSPLRGWVVVAGFRRAFKNHTLFWNESKQLWGFDVNEFTPPHLATPNMGTAPTREAMIEHVIGILHDKGAYCPV
jgi:hypothetical protein